jgi:glycosyltransferase involved in cell wall biosynthesis
MGISLLHSPNYTIPLSAKCKKVCTIHDLTCFNYPQRRKFLHGLYFRKMIALSARYADAIISDSENTKADIVKYFPFAANKIRTVYPAFNPICERSGKDVDRDVPSRLGIPGGYFLFVGTMEPSKNLLRIVEAYDLFRESSTIGHSLVVVGKRGWGCKPVLDRINRSKYKSSILLLGYQPNETLGHLYRGAVALLYPSLYEGFGIPPLEAMASGTPVIASNASSVPEVVGDAALLIDPQDTHDIFERMRQLAEDKSLRSRLIGKGVERVKLFSWEKTVAETIEVYMHSSGSK